MHHPGPDVPILLGAKGVLDWELVLIGAGLLVLIFVGFWFVLRIRRWQKEEEADRVTPQQQLDNYRAMMEEGLLEPGEFEKLRKRLAPGKEIDK
jgi:hypothetical protein